MLYHCLSKSMEKPDMLSQWPDHGDGSCDNKNIVLLKPEFLTVHVLERIAFKNKKKNLLVDIQ